MAGFDASDIDEVIHGRLRLGVMAYLASASPATFTEIARTLQATNGNLSVHLKKLEEKGYVLATKKMREGRPVTELTLTAQGQEAWAHYLDALKPLFPDL